MGIELGLAKGSEIGGSGTMMGTVWTELGPAMEMESGGIGSGSVIESEVSGTESGVVMEMEFDGAEVAMMSS
jgi:hypothetical protein